MNPALIRSLPLLIALLVLTPLVISPGVFAHFTASKAIYARTIIEIIVVVWVVLMLKSPDLRPERSWVIIALALYVIASILAAIYGINPTQSVWSTFDRMTGVFDLLHWFLLTLVLASFVRSFQAWRFLLNGLLAVSLLLSLIAATQVWGFSLIPDILAKCRVDATLGNPSLLAPILVMSVLVAGGLLARSFTGTTSRSEEANTVLGKSAILANQGGQTIFWRGFWVAVIALGCLVLIYTGTRGALIGLVAGAVAAPVALAIWGNRQAMLPVALTFGGILLTVGALFAVDNTVGLPAASNCGDTTATARLTDLAETGTKDSSLALRLSAGKAGWHGFLERPVLGWGPENFGYVFDRHVEPYIFRQGSMIMDKAHNQVVEEFTTKGLVGGLAFLGMWAVLCWVVVRQKRSAGEDVLSYAVLGSLGAYFIQNLFFFDTPSAMLYWAVLVAWVARREIGDRSQAADTQSSKGMFQDSIILQGMRRVGSMAVASAKFRIVAPAALVIALGVSLYYFNLQPFMAARDFGDTTRHGVAHSIRVEKAQESFERFPQMANQTRRLFFLNMMRNWPALDPIERRQASAFFTQEVGIALEKDRNDVPMLIVAVLFIQTTAESPEVLNSVNALLWQLYVTAHNRPEPHQLLAGQAVLEGKYDAALQIAREYQARAPGTEWFFSGIERTAEDNLGLNRD